MQIDAHFFALVKGVWMERETGWQESEQADYLLLGQFSKRSNCSFKPNCSFKQNCMEFSGKVKIRAGSRALCPGVSTLGASIVQLRKQQEKRCLWDSKAKCI